MQKNFLLVFDVGKFWCGEEQFAHPLHGEHIQPQVDFTHYLTFISHIYIILNLVIFLNTMM